MRSAPTRFEDRPFIQNPSSGTLRRESSLTCAMCLCFSCSWRLPSGVGGGDEGSGGPRKRRAAGCVQQSGGESLLTSSTGFCGPRVRKGFARDGYNSSFYVVQPRRSFPSPLLWFLSDRIEQPAGDDQRAAAVPSPTCSKRYSVPHMQHLEAEMGMINHRHNHLRIETEALLRLVLLEGGPSLVEKAVAVLRQLVRAPILDLGRGGCDLALGTVDSVRREQCRAGLGAPAWLDATLAAG